MSQGGDAMGQSNKAPAVKTADPLIYRVTLLVEYLGWVDLDLA